MGSTAAAAFPSFRSGTLPVDQARNLAVQAIDYSLQAYEQGEIRFELLVRFLITIVNNLIRESQVAGQLINDAMRRVCAIQPRQRGRGNPGEPSWLRGLAADMARHLNRVNGFPLNREPAHSKTWACAEAAEILSSAGIPMTASQVEKFYSRGCTLLKPD